MNQYIRPKTAAEKLGVSPKTIYKLVSQGKVEVLRLGGAVCISVDSLERFISSNSKPERTIVAAQVASKFPKKSRKIPKDYFA